MRVVTECREVFWSLEQGMVDAGWVVVRLAVGRLGGWASSADMPSVDMLRHSIVRIC
jgi:hypothetical protein